MTDQRLRICIVAPSLQLGGLENSVALMAGFLAQRGHLVAVALCYRGERFFALPSSVTVFEPAFKRKGEGKLRFYFRWMRFVRSSVREFAPDVVLSYGDFHNALVLAGLMRAGRPVVISDRASPSLRFPWHVRILRSLLYRRAAGVIAQTVRAADAKRTMVGRSVPVRIIPNPVRHFPVCDARGRESLVVAAARHYRVKGLDRLVEAFARCRIPGWTLEIAGSEGPETVGLEQKIKEFGVGDRVKLLGSVKAMERVYSRAAIFVLPSRSEGFPNALIEAMTFGCAPICFDVDAGPSDIIRHGVNGLLVKDGDIDGLATAIEKLATDVPLRHRISANATKTSEELSVDRLGGEVEAFLKEVAGRTGGMRWAAEN